MPQYLIVAHHPPDLCPSSNENVRKHANKMGEEMPGLSEKLGVQLLATYVPMTNHHVYVAVEADDANSVRELAWQGGLSQWNTVEIVQTVPLEDAMGRAQELPTIF
jgi:uncharacterized protein with GYD domain